LGPAQQQNPFAGFGSQMAANTQGIFGGLPASKVREAVLHAQVFNTAEQLTQVVCDVFAVFAMTFSRHDCMRAGQHCHQQRVLLMQQPVTGARHT
jgi:hypothetical protein